MTDFIPYGRTDFRTYIALLYHCIALYYAFALHCIVLHCIAFIARIVLLALHCIALHTD
jgi:hypothetical protein